MREIHMPIARLVVVVETLALILAAPFCATAQERSHATSAQVTRVPASGDFAGLVEIGGGRKMYLVCRGAGSPTVILESGYRNDADIWSAPLEPGMSTVFPQVAKFTRVCAYDRPGTFLDADHLSRSSPVAMPRSARDLVSDLHALLGA